MSTRYPGLRRRNPLVVRALKSRTPNRASWRFGREELFHFNIINSSIYTFSNVSICIIFSDMNEVLVPKPPIYQSYLTDCFLKLHSSSLSEGDRQFRFLFSCPPNRCTHTQSVDPYLFSRSLVMINLPLSTVTVVSGALSRRNLL